MLQPRVQRVILRPGGGKLRGQAGVFVLRLRGAFKSGSRCAFKRLFFIQQRFVFLQQAVNVRAGGLEASLQIGLPVAKLCLRGGELLLGRVFLPDHHEQLSDENDKQDGKPDPCFFHVSTLLIRSFLWILSEDIRPGC